MRREFSLTHTVRYDECGCDGYLTPTAFVRYMQELASRDAEDAKLEGNGFWVVKRSRITFREPVKVHTPLILRTFGMGFSRIAAQRGYEAYLATDDTQDNQESPVISAHTLWVFIDYRGRPIRLPERTADIWLPDGPVLPQNDPPFPLVPSTEPDRQSVTVRYTDTDLNGHFNNAAAVELLENAAWEVYARKGLQPTSIRFQLVAYDIEYGESPLFAEPLEIQTWLEPDPVNAQASTRYQTITRNGKIVVRAHSRWLIVEQQETRL